jgi:hypothetical protein
MYCRSGKRGEEGLETSEEIDALPGLGGHAHRRLRVPQHVLQLGRRILRVERHDRGPELRRREHGDHELGPVRQVQRDAITLLDPQLVSALASALDARPPVRS